MKRFLLLTILFCCGLTTYAAKLKYDSTAVSQTFETRISADFTKHFRQKITLGFSEEIRLQFFNQVAKSATGSSATAYTLNETPDYFRRSYTTLSLGYKPIDYLGINAAYTLRLLGNKDWNDPKEFIRHRATLALTGHIQANQWKFSLRERLDINCRMDSVNTDEKAPVDLRLRHRLHASYDIMGKPIRLFLNFELINTLNAPTDYLNAVTGKDYGQYLSDIRTELGVRWRLDKRNTLAFSYRFNYSNERDIDISKSAKNIRLWQEKGYGHIFAINYEFDW